MSTTQNAKSETRTTDTAPSKTKDINNDALNPKILQQLFNYLKPMIESNKATEKQTETEEMEDVTFLWDVIVIRGNDTVFAKTKGSSTLPFMLAPGMMADAPSRIDQEITDKIAKPLVMAFTNFVSSDALEGRAAREAESGQSD